MNLEQFHHLCRSAAILARVKRVTVFGAAAVTPWVRDEEFWVSSELDLTTGDPETTDLVDGAIGELSLFHKTFGVYGHGVGIDAFKAPPDWRELRNGEVVGMGRAG